MSVYRKMYSRETTLICLVKDWKHAIEHGKSVGVLSTDMSKAFNTMHPTLLLAKLKAYFRVCIITAALILQRK